MKKLAMALAIAGLTVGAVAAAAEKPTVGVVEMNKVMRESKAGKRGDEELRKLADARKKQITAEGQKFEKMREDAQKNEMLMTDKQKEEKQKELQAKLDALRKMEAEANQEIGKRNAELASKIVQDVRAIIAELAGDQGLTVVLNTNPQELLYAVDGVNLTTKVIERLDAKTK